MISGLAEEMACTFPVIKVICFSLHYPTQDCHLCFVLFCFFLKETVWGYGNVLHLNRAEIHRYLFVKTKFHLIHFIIYKGQKVNIRRVFRRILVDAYNLPFFLLFIFNWGINDILEKAMAPCSSTLAWKIPWMEEPGGLQSMGSLKVGHNWHTFTFMHWRRKWQPTPVFLPGESQGQGSLVGCLLWGHTESDTTEAT